MAIKFTDDGFIEVDVTPEMKSEAEKRNKDFLAQYGHNGTHRTNKSRQRKTGYLAEAAVAAVFTKLKYSDDPAVDFKFGNVTFDVKSQGTNAAPKPYFAATLYEEQAKRQVDCYIFARTKNDDTKVWITGYSPKSEYLTKAKLIPAGTKNNNFVYDQSRYEAEYQDLQRPEKLLTKLAD